MSEPVINRDNASSQPVPQRDDAEALDHGIKPRRSSSLFPYLKLALLILVLAFVGYALWKQFKQIDFSTLHFAILPLLGSFLFLFAVSSVQMISYRSLLSAYAHAPRWREMAAVAWVPPLGKYVPGKVAALLGAMYMLRKFKIPGSVAVSVVLALDGLAVLAGLICGAPLLLWQPLRERWPWGWIVCVLVAVVGCTMLHPKIFGRLINLALRRLKKDPLPKMPPIGTYLIPVACAFAQWVFAGLSLWLMARSVTSVEVEKIPLFMSLAALSQTVGYLALFAPGGLGVQDGITLLVLKNVLGPVSAIPVTLFRIARTIVELILAGLGMLVLRNLDKSQ